MTTNNHHLQTKINKLLLIVFGIILLGCSAIEIDLRKDDILNKQLLGESNEYLILSHAIAQRIAAKGTTKISNQEAIEKVVSFSLQSGIKKDDSFSINSCDTWYSPRGLDLYYEIKFSSSRGEGYAVVSTDERVPDILCFVERGSLKDTSYNNGLKMYFRALQQYIENKTAKEYAFSTIQTKVLPSFESGLWTFSHTVYDTCTINYRKYVENWGQTFPYNSRINGANAGCTVVSVAQIMAYHKKPYNNFTTVDWTAMAADSLNYLIPYLYEDLYNSSIDATTNSMVVFLDAAGYTLGALYDGYNFNVLLNALSYGPTILTGKSGMLGMGHAWIADGLFYKRYVTYDIYTLEYNDQIYEYETNLSNEISLAKLVHFDWGWDGFSDGWFSDCIVDPDNAISYDFIDDPEANSNYGFNLKIISYIY